jgi:hypothetical protein
MARKQVRHCVVCGNELVNVRGNTLTCSKLCGKERNRALACERYHRGKHDPIYRKQRREYNERRRADPAFREKEREWDRKRGIKNRAIVQAFHKLGFADDVEVT